jgi:hypothetical protein
LAMQVEYRVTVTGLEEATAAAEAAGRSAAQASAAVGGLQSGASRALPVLTTSLRAVNSTRLAVEQTAKALATMNPEAVFYALLNMASAVTSIIRLMRTLRESTAVTSAAQAVLAALTGRWWLIPLALAAGALVYSRVQAMQSGGPVRETGLYLLHRGEYVLPTRSVTSYGPIFVTFERQPREGADADEWLRRLGPRVAEEARRGS